MAAAVSAVSAVGAAGAAARSVREQVGEAEWAVRVNLAACYRLVHEHGWTEGTANHISARVPGTHAEFLINPYGMLYDEITASSLIRVDLEGNVLFNAGGFDVNRAGYVIHSAIHAARPDVDCVLHTHTLAGMAVSAMQVGLLPIAQTSMRFAEVAYHDFEGLAVDLAERERLAVDLGERDALILRNHGLLTVGPTIAECFDNMYRLERACELQVMALSCNTPLRFPPDEVVRRTQEQFRPKPGKGWGDRAWPALLRRLDRIDPSFRD